MARLSIRFFKPIKTYPSPNADIFFHAGIAYYKLGDYKAARQSFDDCLRTDRDRFEAGRHSKLVQAKIEHEREVIRVSNFGVTWLAVICLILLLFLWFAYYSGLTRTVPFDEPEVAQATNTNATAQKPGPAGTTDANTPGGRVNSALKAAELARVAEANWAEATKVKEAKAQEATKALQAANAARPANRAALTKVAQQKIAEAKQAEEAAKVAEAERAPAAAEAAEAALLAAMPPKPKQEIIVDKSMLAIYTPMLLGLFIIALLLPNLSKLKLPGGIEAEVTEMKSEISTGPKGEIGFGSSLPIISPGPGVRA